MSDRPAILEDKMCIQNKTMSDLYFTPFFEGEIEGLYSDGTTFTVLAGASNSDNSFLDENEVAAAGVKIASQELPTNVQITATDVSHESIATAITPPQEGENYYTILFSKNYQGPLDFIITEQA